MACRCRNGTWQPGIARRRSPLGPHMARSQRWRRLRFTLPAAGVKHGFLLAAEIFKRLSGIVRFVGKLVQRVVRLVAQQHQENFPGLIVS